MPGPGARAWRAEIMRRLRFHGTGGHSASIKSSGQFPVGATWQVAHGPPSPAEVQRSLWEQGSPSRCFLRARPLPPGHNLSILEMSNFMSPPAEPGVSLKEMKKRKIHAPYPGGRRSNILETRRRRPRAGIAAPARKQNLIPGEGIFPVLPDRLGHGQDALGL